MEDFKAHFLPFRNHSRQAFGFRRCEIVDLGTVVSHVVQLPLLTLKADDFPVAVAQSVVRRELKVDRLSAVELLAFENRAERDTGDGPKLA